MPTFLRRLFRLLLPGLLAAALHAAPARPNLLVILSDDQGMGDVSSYGSEIPTPHIDAIGKAGARFESFYVASPICTPSRYGLLTGRYPNRSRDGLLHALMYLDPKDDQAGLRPGETTIAEVLGAAGYRTALVGKWHLGHGDPSFFPQRHGFREAYGSHGGCVDYFTRLYGRKPDWFRNGQPLEETGYTTDLIADEAVRFLERQKKGDPFFLYLAFTAPHYGKGWDTNRQALTNPLQAKPADRARCAHLTDPDRREFAGMVRALDDGIGRVLDALRRRGLERDTLVLFTCDNGGDPRYGGRNGAFRGRKAQLFEGGIRVPCLVQWPRRIKAGTAVRDPATTLDLFPTFCELAGQPVTNRPLDGASLAPRLLKGTPLPERDLFWALPKTSALRRGDWKCLTVGSEDYLFNLATDPAEKNNLAAEQPGRLQTLKAARDARARSLAQP